MDSDMVYLSEHQFPASEIQKMFWITSQLYPENPAYNISSIFNIKGIPDITALHRSVNDIIRRHHILRTGFLSKENDLVQAVIPPVDFRILYIDLTSYSGEEKEKECNRIIEESVNRKFDLREAPLFRIHLLKISNAEHILVMVMHHIIFDMESKKIFAGELSHLYSHYIDSSSLPALSPEAENQYTGFALQQKEILKQNGYNEMIGFWRKSLAGQSGYLNLPHDFQRPPAVKGEGDQYFFELSEEVISHLRKFSKDQSVNLFLTMLALYYVLLHRLSQQNDITTGVPFTNRRNDDSKNVIGCFVNIMPLALTITGKESFIDIVKQVRGVMLGAHRNQEVPYSLIVRDVHPQRDPGYNPLFQAGFTFEEPMKLELEGVEVENITARRYGSQLDIFMTMWESGAAVRGYLEYSTALFIEESACRMVDCYERLAESVINNPDERVDSLPMLSLKDENKIFKQWNNTDRGYDLSITLQRLFEIQAEKTPDSKALVFKEHSLTYRDLNEKSNRLAGHLIRAGVGPDKLVGVHMERSLEMVISLYAILKAGGAYLPLSPELPAMRIRFMVEDADPVVILTQPHLEKVLADFGYPVLLIDHDLSGINESNTENRDIAVTNENLAYCIYTSGSTGKPKGVLVPHKGICNRLHWMQEYFILTGNDRVLQKTPFDFDVSVWEFFWPLISGAALVIAEPGGHRDSAYLKSTIIRERITVIHFVPTMLDIFLREPQISECLSLRYVICSGEALAYPLQQRFFETINCGLYNLYGPTEASVDVTYWKCSLEYGRKVVPIGFPVSNTVMYILNEALQPVPPGVTGNLYIGGVQLARGYLKRDDLTKERFISDPFSPAAGARLYHTGDRARWLPDGAIEYLGRSDFQIKFHGLRIEPGEIEFTMEQYPVISQAVVSPCGEGESMILAAYYTLKPGEACDISALRNYLKETLSQGVIPSVFIEMPHFQTTSSGKIDRKRLPAPVMPEPAGEIMPVNLSSIEQQISDIWKEHLKLENIGIHRNFFDLGGHSLLLTLINHQLRRKTGIDISMVDMFQFPTIASLAEYLGKNKKSETEIEGITDRRKNRQEALQRLKKNK